MMQKNHQKTTKTKTPKNAKKTQKNAKKNTRTWEKITISPKKTSTKFLVLNSRKKTKTPINRPFSKKHKKNTPFFTQKKCQKTRKKKKLKMTKTHFFSKIPIIRDEIPILCKTPFLAFFAKRAFFTLFSKSEKCSDI